MEKLSTSIIPISLSTYLVIFCNSFNLIIVISSCQSWKSIRIQFSTSWIKFSSVIFGEFCSKRVDGDDKCSTVRFKLKIEIVLNQILYSNFVQDVLFEKDQSEWFYLWNLALLTLCSWDQYVFGLFELICFPKNYKICSLLTSPRFSIIPFNF